MTDTAIISFSDVTFSFPGKPALIQDLSFEFHSGTFYVIKGPSGAGKSTLLRLINRLEEPLRGEIRFKSKPLPSYQPPLLRRSILYIQQTPTVIEGSVRDNLLLPFTLRNNKNLSRPDDRRLQTLLRDFLLDDVALEDHAHALSVGQIQRICFIRGLLLDPEILLLDEPASSLDKESGRIVESTALKLCRDSGLTVLMVSHRSTDIQEVEPVIIQMADGQLRVIAWDRK
ncbi:ATP-binding cassette domain-containing protein [Thermodesulfobacteriota bacterium]